MYHSTLGLRVIKKKKFACANPRCVRIVEPPELSGQILSPYSPVERESRFIDQVQPSVCFVLLWPTPNLCEDTRLSGTKVVFGRAGCVLSVAIPDVFVIILILPVYNQTHELQAHTGVPRS